MTADTLIRELSLEAHPEGGFFREAYRSRVVDARGCAAGADYALVGCSVPPGFESSRFELGERATLERCFEQCPELIWRLTGG